MRKKKQDKFFFKQERARIFKDKRHDPYQSIKKHPEPTVCSSCGALYKNGRWTWEEAPLESNEMECPACKRIADGYPAGIIEMRGDYLLDHRENILNLVRNVGKTEKLQHPLERIMKIKNSKLETTVTTTGMHLARRIGDALMDANKGELEYTYEGENYIRVYWSR